MNLTNKITLWISSVLLCSQISANELDSLKQYALENNPEIVRSRNSIADNLGGEIKQRKFPSIKAEWFGGYSERDGDLVDDNQMFEKGLSREKWNSGIYFDIELFDAGRGSTKRKIKKITVDVCESRLQTITIRVLKELELIYFNIRHLKDEKDYLLESIALFKEAKLQSSPDISLDEVCKVLDAEIQKYCSAVDSISNEVVHFENRLYHILGLETRDEPIIESLKFDAEVDELSVEAKIDAHRCLETAFANRSELKEVDAQNNLSKLRSLSKDLAFLPSIVLEAQFNGNSDFGYYPTSSGGYGNGSEMTEYYASFGSGGGYVPKYHHTSHSNASNDSFADAWKAGIAMKWSFGKIGDEDGEKWYGSSPEEKDERMNLVKDMIRQQLSSILLRMKTVTMELRVLKSKLHEFANMEQEEKLSPDSLISKRAIEMSLRQKQRELITTKVLLKYATGG